MKRAILMSGSAFTNFAFYQPNNHIELFKEIFELDANATADDVLQFMLNAPVEVILQKSPAINVRRNVIELSFAAVIEGLLIMGSFSNDLLIFSSIFIRPLPTT